jgi:hypothetical protein
LRGSIAVSDETNQVRPSVEEQVDDIITEETDWVALAEQLDVSRYQYGDSHPDWTSGTPFRPMFLTYLLSEVEDEALGTLRTRLEDDAELAAALGFDPDALPSETTFRPCRVTDRFETLQHTVEDAAETIRNVSARRGAPIGFRLDITSEDDDDGEPSKRTIQRLLRKTGRDVLEELKTVAIPSISLPRSDDVVYDDDELLVLEAIAAIEQLAANNAGEKLGDKKNPNPNLDDPFYKDGPSGETLLAAIKEMDVEQIATVLNFALRKSYTRAKPSIQELENDDGHRFGVRAKVALDITYVAYYGDCEEMKWVQGTPDDKSYSWCHKFATVVIVGENTHYVVGVCPLGSSEWADTDAYAGKDRSYYIGDVARRLLSIADNYVTIRTVYADREFHAVDVLYTLEQKNLKYVIPAAKDQHRISTLCDDFDEKKSGYDDKGDTPLYVKSDHAMYGRVKGDKSNTRVTTNVVVLPPDEGDDVHKEGSPQPFVTNYDMSDDLAYKRRYATQLMEAYSDRAAIENAYSSIKQAAAWTTSKEFEVRWFHFAFGCLVYNMWLLMDFLVQERIDVIETLNEPRITLAQFLDWLQDELITLI